MSAAFNTMPLADVTHTRLSMANKSLNGKAMSPVMPLQETASPLSFRAASESFDFSPMFENRSPLVNTHSKPEPTPIRVRRNDPYNWAWCRDVAPTPTSMPAPQSPLTVESVATSPTMNAALDFNPQVPAAATPVAGGACRALVQFKCHHGEFASPMALSKGQYVVVEGDRGIDIGVVIRINSDDSKQYVERTGPAGAIVRYATQREVDYWATDLKADEAQALEYCRQRVQKHRLAMDVRHAEYQFDKKKLTFYYEAKSRVDFVTLLKELFREFSCRIWMEKVRVHE